MRFLLPALALATSVLAVHAADDYPLGPDSQPQAGVPEGEVKKSSFTDSKVFPGTTHDWALYIPKQYDAAKPVKLTGTVTKVEWTNPHTWFYLDVKDSSGKVTNWGFEMGSPNGLMRQGWTRNSIKPGDEVTVEGSSSKDGSNNVNVKVAILAGTGQRLFGNSSQTAADTPVR